MDLLTGLMLLGFLSAVLFVAMQTRARAAARLAESRSALRTAEAALGELQAGAAHPSPRQGVEVRIVDDAQTPAPAGMRWVRVETTCAGKTISLRGVVPTTAAAAGGAP